MKVDKAISELLNIVESLRLEYKHTNKKFTLDGRLVGDIGEIIVSEEYGIRLFSRVVEKYDGISSDNKLVQIKATFKESLGFPSSEKDVPDYYIGIKINHDGTVEEVYNGPGYYIWLIVKDLAKPKNSLHSIKVSKLMSINKSIKDEEKVKKSKKVISDSGESMYLFHSINSKRSILKKLEKEDLQKIEKNKKGNVKSLEQCNMGFNDLVGKYYDPSGFIYDEIDGNLYMFLLQFKELRRKT